RKSHGFGPFNWPARRLHDRRSDEGTGKRSPSAVRMAAISCWCSTMISLYGAAAAEEGFAAQPGWRRVLHPRFMVSGIKVGNG
ncbi:hypothetical protein NQ283_29080, partial [Escherichia coli]|nr:hypothetical protein [Escherichia coli]